MIDGPTDHIDGGLISKLTVPKISPEDSVVGEWVKVDMVREVGCDNCRDSGTLINSLV